MEKVMGKVSSGIKTGKQDTKMKIFFIALSGVRDRTIQTRDFFVCVRLKDGERIFFKDYWIEKLKLYCKGYFVNERQERIERTRTIDFPTAS